MLSFMNSKQIKMTGKDKQNPIFQKSKFCEISITVVYTGEDREFFIHVFYWCIPLDHEIYTKCKKNPSNLIKGISSHNICSGIKIQHVKKTEFVIQYQKHLIFLRIPLFRLIESLSTIQFHVGF